MFAGEHRFETQAEKETRMSRQSRKSVRTPLMETLEPRMLLNADLAISLVDVSLSQTLIPGDRGSVTVRLTNVGTAAAQGVANIYIWGSTDTTLDAGDALIGSKLNLKGSLGVHDDTGLMTVKVTVPSTALPSLPGQHYYAIAQVVSTMTSPDVNPDNDVQANSAVNRDIVWQFGTFADHKNVKLTVSDGNGPVTFAVTGGGSGTVTPASDGIALFDNVTLTGTTAKSNFSIATPKKRITSIDTINVQHAAGTDTGSLKGISAPTTDIEAGITVDGLLSTLVVHDITSVVHYITLNAADLAVPAKSAVSITAGSINTCTVDTGGIAINSFKATNIVGLDLTTESVKSITVSNKTPELGNLSGTLHLNGALGKLTASGSISGLTIHGNDVGTIQASQWTSGAMTAEAVKALNIKHDMLVDVTMNSLASAKIGGGLSGTWTSSLFGSITVGGDMTGCTLSIPGVPADGVSYTDALKKLTVAGWIADSSIETNFAIGSITASGLDGTNIMPGVSGTALPIATGDFESHHVARIKSLTIKGIKDTNKHYVDSFIDTNIAAWRIDAITFGWVETSNVDAFGIAADSIGKMSYRHFDGTNSTSTNLGDPATDSFADGAFNVTLV